MPRVLVLVDRELPEQALADWQEVTQSFANFQGEPVTLALGDAGSLQMASASLHATGKWELQEVAPAETEAKNAPMSSADFVWREDGRPDWAAMWTNFCELALYGGPPHRGEAEALLAPEITDAIDPKADAMMEIRRGIYETTGLFAEPAEPGWMKVSCRSPKMAAWLCATILLENVEARCDGDYLYLPASPDFALTNEVKSVITVLAKTNHYWEAHIASTGG